MKRRALYSLAVSLVLMAVSLGLVPRVGAQAPKSGSVGLEGTISSPPPSQGAIISLPVNGQTFTNAPITVSGLCFGEVMVQIFRNEVFAGSTPCNNGSFSLQIDLFSGQNDLVARVYDSLDQAGPDSNHVTVTFNDGRPVGAGPRVSITSPYAKRGTNPGDNLTWPITISGGAAPYAISIDWGDGSPLELKVQSTAGNLNLQHVYAQPGVYNIIIRATDANGVTAFLQVVGITNGKLTQAPAASTSITTLVCNSARKLWLLALIMILLIIISFWLGKRYQLVAIRKKMQKIAAENSRL